MLVVCVQAWTCMTIRKCSSVYRLLRSGCKNRDFCMFSSSTCGWEIMVLHVWLVGWGWWTGQAPDSRLFGSKRDGSMEQSTIPERDSVQMQMEPVSSKFTSPRRLLRLQVTGLEWRARLGTGRFWVRAPRILVQQVWVRELRAKKIWNEVVQIDPESNNKLK